MSPLRILILEAQVPFVHGGAEILVRQLHKAIAARGHLVDVVSVPVQHTPKGELWASIEAWRRLEVTRAGSRDVDLVIATKFPTYFVRHPRKVLWLVHQHRAAYELCGTRYSDFTHAEHDVALRRHLIESDTVALRDCVAHYTIARTVTARLQTYNGIAAEPLYSPPQLAGRLHGGPFDSYVLTVTRLEHVKRVDLVLDAMARVRSGVKLIVAGDGSARRELEIHARHLEIEHRVTFLGRVDDDQLIDLYSRCRGVVFVPYQEDYGYVTLEAFLSGKPVVTATDSGGPLEFVEHGRNGLVCDPTPDALAEAIDALATDRARAEAYGREGEQAARTISWDAVVDRLTAPGAAN